MIFAIKSKAFAFHIPSFYRCPEEGTTDEDILQPWSSSKKKILEHQIIHKFYCTGGCASLNNKYSLQTNGFEYVVTCCWQCLQRLCNPEEVDP